MKRVQLVMVACLAVAAMQLAAVEATPRVTLKYFDIRGRAESIRMVLEYLRVPYKDQRLGWEDWLEVKKSGDFAFEQLPALEWCPDRETTEGCFTLVQSHTILQFLARKFDVYGAEEQRHWVDLVTDGTEDFKSKLGRMVYGDTTPEDLQEYLTTTAVQWLGHFERLKTTIDGGKHTFFTSETATHADIFLFVILEAHVRLGGKAILEDFPNLTAFFDEVASLESVASYRNARFRRPRFSNGGSSSFDNANSPPAFNDWGQPWSQKDEL